jgi:hypothetical protein
MRLGLTGNLRRYVDYDFAIELPARTVHEAVRLLGERYPRARPVLLDGAGHVRSIHRLVLNGTVLDRAELGSAVGPRDELVILTPITAG